MLSICIFGSKARGTADEISDLDVLFVGEQSSELDDIVKQWKNQKWNVSVFNHAAFERLADLKILFIQHLKQEGQIIRDDKDFLNNLFARYSPKKDYSGERNDSLRQIAMLPSLNGRYWHDLCLADITYVLFRNAAILHLANEEKYCFQYEDLINHMATIFRLTNEQVEAIRNLRSLKHGYRQRIEGMTLPPNFDVIKDAVSKIIEQLPDQASSSIAEKRTTKNYLNLRMKELSIVNNHNPAELDNPKKESTISKIWKEIMNSDGYPPR